MSTATDGVEPRPAARIGIDVGKALGELDGIGRYVRGLLAGLAELEGELEPSERFDYRLHPLSRCRRVGTLEDLAAMAPGFAAAPRAPQAGEVDLFHATAWEVPATHAGALALTLYDLTFLRLPETHTLGNRTRCLTGLARAVARGGKLCAISESVRREAAEELAIDPSEIAVAAPGIGAELAPRGKAEIEPVLRRLAIDRPYVLALGTVEPRKNLGALLEAWSRLPGALRDTHRLAVAGDEGWTGALTAETPRETAARLGLADEVRWLGRVADELLPALYSGASVFVYPSLSEGFGLPPLEAMACGAPVVASDRPALPEVLGDAALLVDPASPEALASAIARVLTDRRCADELRAAGPPRAARYTWRATAEATRRLWERALGERSAGAARVDVRGAGGAG